MSLRSAVLVLSTALLVAACVSPARETPAGPVFEITFDPALHPRPFAGRAFVFLSKLEPEPRLSTNPARLEPVIAAHFEGLAPGAPLRLDGGNSDAFPVPARHLEGGVYWAQAVLDLAPDAPWPGRAAGNLCSVPVRVEVGGARGSIVRLTCDRLVPATLPAETRYVRILEVPSRLLTEFHGRPQHLRALVHLPEEWFSRPEREFPLFLFLSGFGASLAGFQTVDWPAPPIDGEPFVRVFPDPSCRYGHSGFVDSDNNGPWARAFVEELLPALGANFRGIDDREARVVAGHSSGGWSALWLMAKHPQVFGAAWASSPDPVDFRDFMGVNLYAEGANLLFAPDGSPRPFCTLGPWVVNYTVEHARREEVLRGGVLAFFEALLGGRTSEHTPERLFDRSTGRVDPAVVSRWRRHDLSLYLREHWEELGSSLEGRLLLTVGDRDNFLLQGSVELFQRELEVLGARVEVRTLSGDHFSQLDSASSAEQVRAIVDRFREWRGK